jgi:hypothetical protein
MTRLDETEAGETAAIADNTVRFLVPPHALRTLAIRWRKS